MGEAPWEGGGVCHPVVLACGEHHVVRSLHPGLERLLATLPELVTGQILVRRTNPSQRGQAERLPGGGADFHVVCMVIHTNY